MSIQEFEIVLPGSKTNKMIPKRKQEFATKLRKLLDEYDTCLIVTIDNIGSKHIAQMRKYFRGTARFIFGKNTLIRKIIRDYIKDTQKTRLFSLLDLVKGNCGFCFTKGNIRDIHREIISYKLEYPAKPGIIAPNDVFIPPCSTGMEPTQSTFSTFSFPSMNIPTRINHGQIEIISEVHLIQKGKKVNLSESQLLTKLGIKPFYYGMKVISIYDNGESYEFLGMSQYVDWNEIVTKGFYNGLKNISALCFTLNYPTIINVPYYILNTYKKVLAIGLELDTYTFPELEKIKKILENPDVNPDAFAAATVISSEKEVNESGGEL